MRLVVLFGSEVKVYQEDDDGKPVTPGMSSLDDLYYVKS